MEKISKRGVAFLFFLAEWANLVNKTVVQRELLPWYDLPGYQILLKVI